MVMTTQNAPGIALLKAVHYKPPVNQIVHFGGTLSLLGAGFGGAGVNLSAMTATIAISPDKRAVQEAALGSPRRLCPIALNNGRSVVPDSISDIT